MGRQSIAGTSSVIGKARSSTVDSRVRQTGSDDVDADRRRDLMLRSAEKWSSSWRLQVL